MKAHVTFMALQLCRSHACRHYACLSSYRLNGNNMSSPPFQIFTARLATARPALCVLIRSPDEYNPCHPAISYVIISLTLLVQPS
jgi:hypothetical protein